MLIFKLIGAVTVLISFSYMGYLQFKKICDREREIKELKIYFISIAEDAKISMKKISTLFKDNLIGKHLYTEAVFNKYIENLENKEDLHISWEIAKQMNTYPLNDEILSLLDSYFYNLKCTGVEEFVVLTDNLIKCLDSLTDTDSKNKKLFFNLWIFSGALTVILLL